MSRVRRASTPLRIHASSCFQNVSNLRLPIAFGGQLVALARFVRRVVARIRAKEAAVELDDPRRDAVEEHPVVRDHDRGGLLAQELLEQRDAVDVEVVGRLVEQQEIGRERERQRKRRALALAAGRLRGRHRLVETEAMQVLDQPRLGAPVLALVVQALVKPAAQREALAQRGRRRQRWLLLDQHGAKAVATLDLAVVEIARAVDHVQERGLARAVAADEADVLALVHDKAARSRSGCRPKASSASWSVRSGMTPIIRQRDSLNPTLRERSRPFVRPYNGRVRRRPGEIAPVHARCPADTHDPMADFLSGGGSTGALMRAHDWSRSPSARQSPGRTPCARSSSSCCSRSSRCSSRGAMRSASSTTTPYAEILGAKHPHALGNRFHDIWSEIWPDISPLIDAAMSGQATYREDLPLVMNRKGFDEQTWFTFSYSPVRDDRGNVGGMFCAVLETTRRVLAERELRELNETLERRVSDAIARTQAPRRHRRGHRRVRAGRRLEYRWLAVNKAAADEFERIFGARPQIGASMLDLLARSARASGGGRGDLVPRPRGRGVHRGRRVRRSVARPPRATRCASTRFAMPTARSTGAYQFVFDVTERLRDQERLRNAEQALRQAQKTGVARPAHRRRGARLQQPARGVRQRRADPGARSDAAAAREHPRCACDARWRAAPD